jgi:hypothetical protein
MSVGGIGGPGGFNPYIYGAKKPSHQLTDQQVTKLQAELIKQFKLKSLDTHSPEFIYLAQLAGHLKVIADEIDKEAWKTFAQEINKQIAEDKLRLDRR